jgi:NADPH2:quinone reductase
MKAIVIRRTGGPEALEYADVPTPKPGPGEVLVRAHAIGVNYFDLLIRTGRYRWMPKLPFIPGNEMSGHVTAMGEGARRWPEGQAVFVAGYDIGNRGGLYAEYVAVPQDALWPLPAGVDLDKAVALTNYQLAFILMHQAAAGIEARDVVIYGAAGGVGTALIDIARLAGARAIGVAGSAEKCAFIRKRGAEAAINYVIEPVVERVKALTDGRGADLLFDHVAGNDFADGLKMLAPLGMLVSYGLLGGMPKSDLFAEMRNNLEHSPAVRCFTMHTYDHMLAPRRAAMASVVEMLAEGAIDPAIAGTLPLKEASRAHAAIEGRHALGKIVLKP